MLGYIHFDKPPLIESPLAALINEEDKAVHNALFLGPVQFLGLLTLINIPDEYTPVRIEVDSGVPHVHVHEDLGLEAFKACMGGATIMRFSGSVLRVTGSYGGTYDRDYEIPLHVLQWMQDLLVYVGPEMLRVDDKEEFYSGFRQATPDQDARRERFGALEKVCAFMTLEQLTQQHGVQVIGKVVVYPQCDAWRGSYCSFWLFFQQDPNSGPSPGAMWSRWATSCSERRPP